MMVLLLSLFSGAGCGAVLSDSVMRDSDPDLKFREVKEHPERYRGRTVVFGGTIARVIHLEGQSVLEIVERPLGFRLEPQLTDETGGRFLVRTEKFLDDKIFQSGRKITVAGKVTEPETRSLGESQYTYPTLVLREHHLWDTREAPAIGIHFGFGATF